MPNKLTWLQATAKLEKQFHTPLVRVITAYRAPFIHDLKTHGKQTAINNLNLSTVVHAPLLKIINAIYKTAGLMGAKMTWQELKAAANQKAGGFGRNEQWVNDVNAYLRFHALSFVQDITDTMRQDILNVLQKGVDEGWSIDQIVVQLKSVGLVQSRARVIARTETIRAANVGHAVAAASSPYEVNKKWYAAHDIRTRHSHRFIDGHIVDENDTFKVPIYKGNINTGAFDNMQFPGDPSASAANTINCRCRVTYLPKRDEMGRLIMKNPNQARVIPINSPHRIPVPAIAAALKANITIGIE